MILAIKSTPSKVYSAKNRGEVGRATAVPFGEISYELCRFLFSADSFVELNGKNRRQNSEYGVFIRSSRKNYARNSAKA